MKQKVLVGERSYVHVHVLVAAMKVSQTPNRNPCLRYCICYYAHIHAELVDTSNLLLAPTEPNKLETPPVRDEGPSPDQPPAEPSGPLINNLSTNDNTAARGEDATVQSSSATNKSINDNIIGMCYIGTYHNNPLFLLFRSIQVSVYSEDT